MSGIGLALFLGSPPTAIDTHEARRQPTAEPAENNLVHPNPTATPVWPRPTWEDVGPLLAQKCGECHGAGTPIDYEAVLEGGPDGPLIVPGDASTSRLVILQAGRDHPGQLSGDELAQVITWVMNGAPR